MPCQILFENANLTGMKEVSNVSTLKQNISLQYGIPSEDLFVTINGKAVPSEYKLESNENIVRVCTKLVGGKGGFGSMLRAIGAQIEKTTNREACRDLSGRRLRDINEEKRLRKWLEGQDDREKEAAERKQKKLERLLAEPKIEVNLNPKYELERQELPERVSAALDAGLQAAGGSEMAQKRKLQEEKGKAKKKSKLWIDADLSDCDESTSDEEEEGSPTALGVTTDSGNESDKTSESKEALKA